MGSLRGRLIDQASEAPHRPTRAAQHPAEAQSQSTAGQAKPTGAAD